MVRNCGATTGYVTHINIVPTSDAMSPRLTGVVDNGEVFVTCGYLDVDVEWRSVAQLVIRHPALKNECGGQRLTEFQGTKIVYELK
jgi:hypothetical protein